MSIVSKEYQKQVKKTAKNRQKKEKKNKEKIKKGIKKSIKTKKNNKRKHKKSLKIGNFAIKWCGLWDLNSHEVNHTPLKRTRLPVSPRPQRLCNYIITIIIFQVLIYKTIIKISNWAILNSKYEELSCFYWILFNLILI